MNLDTRQQIWTSYGILAALLVAVVSVVIWPPIGARFRALEGISSARAMERQAHAAIAKSAAANAAAAQKIDDALLFKAHTDALAAAELQKTIRALVKANGGALESTAFKRSSQSLPLVPVTVVVRLRCSVAALLEIFDALDQKRPQLFISDVTVQSRHLLGRALRNIQDELDVQFDVTGYLAPAGAKGASDED